MRHMISVIALGALGLAGLATPVQAATPPLVAIENARIVPVSGPVIEKGTLVFRNGIITDVGASIATPKGAWIIDGNGLTVYPGLIDAYSSWGLAESAAPAAGAGRQAAQAAPAVGATPAARSWGPADRPGTNSWVRAADLIKPSEKKVEQARSAGFTSAATFPRQGLVGGHGAIINLGGETAGAMVVEPSIGLQMSLSPSGYMGYPSSGMGVFAYFRQLWLDADHYTLAQALYKRQPAETPRPAYDHALEGVLEARRVLLPAASPTALERILALSSDLKTPAVVYGVVEGYEMAARLKETATPAVLNLKWPTKERDSDPEHVDSLRTLEIRDKAPTSPVVLSKAGVKWAISSDGLESARDIAKALKKSIDLGLKKEDALRALTLSAAEIYGVDARLGSIDKGKIANVVVTNGDLFDDKTKVVMVFVDGVKYLPAIEAARPGPGAGNGQPPAPVEEEER
jgi:imidazolonepropionase-like amidohydrolase